MAYLSLYRKYRSQSFEEVAGQQHVTRTLQNAIRGGRVAHAYLFCGPRGTGKTSTARLLAKALNCEQGPTPEPCNTCSACVEIAEGRFLDIIEIDAASNRGIDDIRDLRESVQYAPNHGRRKVYVIDEAHQITGDAFNAFLKTLEEPPPHVVFIMATTEAHKIPATIVSRCQKFEFRRASLEHLRDRIHHVCASEGAEIEDGAVDLIARNANGGWRDALSLLEQVLAFSEGKATARDVYTVLGTVEAEVLLELAAHIREANGAEVFRVLEALIVEGKDARQLLRDVTGHYRELMLAGAGAHVAADADYLGRLSTQAEAYGNAPLVAAVEVLAQAEREARWSEQPRLLLELAVVRLMNPRAAPTAAPIRPQPPAAAPAARPASAPQPRPEPTRPQRPAPAPFVDEPSRSAPAPPQGFTVPDAPPPLTVGDARAGLEDDDDLDDPFNDVTPAPAPEPAPQASPLAAARPPERRPEPPPNVQPAPAAEPAGDGAPRDVDLLQRKWKVIVEELKRRRQMSVYACLADTQPDRFEHDVLVVRFPSSTMAQMFSQRGKAFADAVSAAVLQVTGIACKIRPEEGVSGGGPAATSRTPAPASAPRTGGNGASHQNPTAAPDAPAAPASPAARPPTRPAPGAGDLVHEVLEVFDGKIVDELDLQGE